MPCRCRRAAWPAVGARAWRAAGVQRSTSRERAEHRREVVGDDSRPRCPAAGRSARRASRPAAGRGSASASSSRATKKCRQPAACSAGATVTRAETVGVGLDHAGDRAGAVARGTASASWRRSPPGRSPGWRRRRAGCQRHVSFGAMEKSPPPLEGGGRGEGLVPGSHRSLVPRNPSPQPPPSRGGGENSSLAHSRNAPGRDRRSG